MTIQLSLKAADPKAGMTLAELSQLLRQAVEAGVSLDTHVSARVGWSGQLQSSSTKEPR